MKTLKSILKQSLGRAENYGYRNVQVFTNGKSTYMVGVNDVGRVSSSPHTITNMLLV